MQKILELTEKEFLTGIAPSSQVQDKGLWYEASGITVMRDPFASSTQIGILQGAPAATDITNAVINNIPFAWLTDISASAKTMYIWDRGGDLYTIDLDTDGLPVKITSSALTNAANGLFLITHSTGNKRLWYFRKDGIGYYGNIGSTPTFNNSVYTTQIENTEYHHTHRFFDRNYFCNGRYIGSVEDDGASGLTVTPRALDFETVESTRCISDDGNYLVIGVTANANTDSYTRAPTRIVFWDTNSSSWSREWAIPDASILSIRRVGLVMEAVTTRGLFWFTFNTPPQPALPYTPTTYVPDLQYPAQYATDVLGEAIAIGGYQRISTFGKMTPDMPSAYFQPFAGFDSTVSLVAASAKLNQLIVGTITHKLYRVTLSDTPQTGVSAKTIFIDLHRWYQVGRIVVAFDHQLASGDSLNIDVQGDSATSATDWSTVSYALHGAVRVKEMYGSKEARKLKLIFNFNGGAVRIRNVQVWGDPISTPTHTRA
jgi:hypothetical protein